MRLAIVTRCPTGVATTFVAARILADAASERGWASVTEVHNSLRPPLPLTASDIATADVVVLVGTAPEPRFSGKRLVSVTLEDAMQNGNAVLDRVPGAPVWQPTASSGAPATAGLKIVAVTACPTGVAHTFMAAEALEQTARAAGHQIKVETRGSVGAKNELSAADIAAADLVILATDIEVDTARFNGKKVYRTSTGNALKRTADELKKAVTDAKVLSATSTTGSEPAKEEKVGVYKHLMTGVSFMLPMVVAGGLIIALSFVFGIKAFEVEGTLAAALMKIGGGSAFALMIPVLAGYIAFSIADRPGLAPGMIGGMLASSLGAGFLGGIIAGLLAGYSTRELNRYLVLPQTMAALKPILLLPLLSSLLTGLVMIYVVGTPVATIMASLTEFLQQMGSGNAILLGVVLGAMMCFDLGGPVNKAAYAFGVGLLASKSYLPMAAIMASGMVPPLGVGLATLIAKAKFTKPEQEAGRAALALGACFISEGAIPFAAKDPLRFLPCSIVGGAITGALSMWAGITLMAPHGGVFVLFIPNAVNQVLPYLLAIVAGSVVTGIGYAVIKPKAA